MHEFFTRSTWNHSSHPCSIDRKLTRGIHFSCSLGKDNFPPPSSSPYSAPQEKHLEHFHFISGEKADGVSMVKKTLGVAPQTTAN
ncbi:hypothetical protein KY290_033414 [Solanum tuberosum]|uniref:Uncharacterized protein n=1 Tax=Solanum tuberosum TaxID=4113 RepID=A0ABQ7U1Z3_SOLTU|nr:hypothetical protein KY289_032775 [Solanum tuberosum]KAH0647416.1 hypothetical protein KY285_032664 [Solanum tuberosum]KAH0740371.1 hypothetical protein KY290_033414 [Solanum tuberosum]